MKRPIHICVIRFSSLGDLILNSSIFAAIKNAYGNNVKISLLTSKEFSPLYIDHPLINVTYGYDRKNKGILSLMKYFKKLHKESPIDYILDLHCTLRSLLIRVLNPSIPRIFVDKRTIERFILTFFKVDILSLQFKEKRSANFGELLLERNPKDFSKLLGLNYERKQLEDFLEKTASCEFKRSGQISSCGLSFHKHPIDWSRLTNSEIFKGKYICFAPSASFPEKRWPAKYFKELMKLMINEPRFNEFKLVILAGPSDHFCEIFNDFNENVSDRVVNLQGKTSLVESTAILKDAAFCIGNDTGIPHFSESVGTPAIFILGPTGEQFGFYPHLKKSKAIFKNLWCRPCTTNGKGNCIRSERFCLNNILPEQVLDESLKMLEVV